MTRTEALERVTLDILRGKDVSQFVKWLHDQRMITWKEAWDLREPLPPILNYGRRNNEL